MVSTLTRSTRCQDQITLVFSLNYLPPLSSSQAGQFFLVSISSSNNAIVYQWADPATSSIVVLLTNIGAANNAVITLSPNVAAIVTSYNNAGYTNFQQAFQQVFVSSIPVVSVCDTIPPRVAPAAATRPNARGA